MLNCDRSTVKHALQNTQNDCYQWLSNSSRVHQIRFRPGPAGLRGLLLSGGEERGRERRGGDGGEEVGEKQGTGEWKGRGRDTREKGRKGRESKEEGEEGREEEGRKVRTPLPSIPAYAPVARCMENAVSFHPTSKKGVCTVCSCSATIN